MLVFSSMAREMRSSAIRNLMKLAADPKIISFAGGMPNNDLFPVDIVDQLYQNLPGQLKKAAFQYSPTAGFEPLLEVLGTYLSGKGIDMQKNALLITSGAQQAINLLGKVFLDPGDTVITEDPCFIGAAAAFKSYGAELCGVALDDDGIDTDALAKTLHERPQSKFLYLSPHFHNPAGILYRPERKQKLLETVQNANICLIEDDPYGELYFDEQQRALTVPLKAMAQESMPICYVGSFSKIFGPGMRLGWLCGPAAIVEKCELAKQSMDACSSTFTQALAYAFLSQNKLKDYLSFLRPIYRKRAALMLDALERFMPSEIAWTRPKGGFYVWVTMPERMNATTVFEKSIGKGAAFVIGGAFDPQGVRNNCFRLAFSHTPENAIEKGIAIISNAVREEIS